MHLLSSEKDDDIEKKCFLKLGQELLLNLKCKERYFNIPFNEPLGNYVVKYSTPPHPPSFTPPDIYVQEASNKANPHILLLQPFDFKHSQSL